MTTLTMFRGDSERYELAITEAGVAVDVTGGKIYFTAKRAISDADLDVFQKSWIAGVSSGISVATPSTGIAVVAIAPVDTSGFENALVKLIWDAEFVSSTGDVTTIASGVLFVTPDVTRSA